MKKKILSIILSAFAVISILLTGSAAVTAMEPSEVCNSVVVVSIWFDSDEYGPKIFSYGTGFFVGKQGEDPSYIVTNAHVTKMYEQSGKGTRGPVTFTDNSGNDIVLTGRAFIRVFFDSNDYEEAYVVESDSVKDVSLLKLSKPTSKRVPLKLTEPSNDIKGKQIYAIGYPGISDNLLKESTSKWGKDDASVAGGVFERLYVETGTGVDMIQLGFTISGGNSGGPVVNDNGEVIGIATSGVKNSESSLSGAIRNGDDIYFIISQVYTESVNYAHSISNAIPLLNRNSVEYDLVTASGSNTQASEQNSTAESTAAASTPSQESSSNNSDNTLVIILCIVIGVLAAGGVAVVVLVINSGKKKAEAEKEELKAKIASLESRDSTPKAPVKTAYIRSMSDQHGNSRIKMNPGMQISIGRSSDCKIRFKDDTAGVSGTHCTVKFDGDANVFILTDMKSTYGTFLQDGTKLAPNKGYKLRSGDKFYLGDKANMICVDLE